MTDNAITRESMESPIERLFEREFPSAYGTIHEPRKTKAGTADPEKVDMLYLEKTKGGLHAVRIENTYDDCMFDLSGGIHTLNEVAANRHWIALPLDEFRDGDEEYNGIMRETCEERGIGVITIQPKGRGVSAKTILEAEFKEGDHLGKYGELEQRWKQETKDVLVGDDYKVVKYYNR